MAMFRGPNFKTPIMRASYMQNMFKPRSQDGGKPKYGMTLIGNKADLPFFEKIVAEVLVGEWGDKGLVRFKAGSIRSPILMGDGKEARNKDTGEIQPGLGPDKFFIRVQSGEDRPPFVIWKDPNTQETEATVYSGCFGKAVLNCFAWKHPTSGDGISFGIAGFQKFQDGESLGGGGRVSASDYYENVGGDDLPADVKSDGASGLFG